MSNAPIRVRFAPSPTGDLHVGNARTALFNWLFARHAGGRFLLRIEDTDRERSRPEHERQLLADLRWLGLGWDEGIEEGGEDGPYRQSERLPLYHQAADRLIEAGAAYRCFCDPAVLEAERAREREAGRASLYSGRCRVLERQVSAERARAGESCAIRFDVGATADQQDGISFEDLVHGPVRVPVDQIGDFVLLRRDGGPAYNFAVVVDDAAMRISHVIRGDDHLSNTPRQVLLARALGFASPCFAHLPLLVAPGGAPLSKREGAVSVRALFEAGYPPEAVLNHLALLGWSPPGGVEVLTREELVAAFDLKRVSRSPAVFDRPKLDALSMRHLQRWDPSRLVGEAAPVLQEAGLLPPTISSDVRAWSQALVGLVSDRLTRLGELPDLLGVVFAFNALRSLADVDVRSTLADPAGRKVVRETLGLLADEPLTAPRLQGVIAEVRRRTGAKGKDLFHPIRVGLTGFGSGPELVRLLPVLDEGSRLELPRPVPGCAERARALLAATEA
ncbi:MAG TPA: glutamate--tRNA ligase [Candidatus Polarisedimenticolia bacterium]|jgi:glutamyl-tRNA synthetase/nondiscriminating glutamyl-tRNA synthetase|nr:glutamate--tRNA ligase [Candidatus Polarisedimenticolia bacterium]